MRNNLRITCVVVAHRCFFPAICWHWRLLCEYFFSSCAVNRFPPPLWRHHRYHRDNAVKIFFSCALVVRPTPPAHHRSFILLRVPRVKNSWSALLLFFLCVCVQLSSSVRNDYLIFVPSSYRTYVTVADCSVVAKPRSQNSPLTSVRIFFFYLVPFNVAYRSIAISLPLPPTNSRIHSRSQRPRCEKPSCSTTDPVSCTPPPVDHHHGRR